MAITLSRFVIRRIVKAILLGEDHRLFVYNQINDAFVEGVLEFLTDVLKAKSKYHKMVDDDWYLNELIIAKLDKSEIAWNSGLNMKSIENRRGSVKKEVVLSESIENYGDFVSLVDSIEDKKRLEIGLKLSVEELSISLNFIESVVVLNALAVRRGAIRGGAWSSLGKQVEGPLMEVLCRLYEVPPTQYRRVALDDESIREVDFYLISPEGKEARCEVKLMGKGNPESADAVVARESNVFVASTLSDINKRQLDERGVHWTELHKENGFVRFGRTLAALGIEHTSLQNDADHTDLIQKTVSEYFC